MQSRERICLACLAVGFNPAWKACHYVQSLFDHDQPSRDAIAGLFPSDEPGAHTF